MSAPDTVCKLVENFERNNYIYTSKSYNEAQTRREFIDPFFAALGWDVGNVQGSHETYKDVVLEDTLKIGRTIKAPDYSFWIGGKRVFFVEAKKPSINIESGVDPAYQVRRYGWSAKLPVSILTDFEEFAIYDCRIRPVKSDSSQIGRVKYYPYTKYIDEWDNIAELFSRDAVRQGSLYNVEKLEKVRGTGEVDDAFLSEIELWRDMLARNIARRNPVLSQRELNFSVQRIIDRIIFLRIAEDRGLEEYGRLQELAKCKSIYKQLTGLFLNADNRYNSGLFHFKNEKGRNERPDALTMSLVIDDKPLRDIFKRLYYPDSPYAFSVIPPEILGQVYERFLGKVIRLMPGHQAEVEEKPEVHKAGGVYYTPRYIVDYIVKQTVGRIVEKKNPDEVSALRILDPACGSGSFLLGAYQFLLDWHLRWYICNKTNESTASPKINARRKKSVRTEPPIVPVEGGGYRLTSAERKRILLNNIYGVDIDPQAVEVSKLSLLLTVLEGENSDTLDRQLALGLERALPDLDGNIKCGNSLIESDFYSNMQFSLLTPEDHLRINAFDWNGVDGFPDIMQNGGFDVIIGNPPYGAEIPDMEKGYLKHTWDIGTTDTAALFVELGMRLKNTSGMMSYIIPKPFIYASNWAKLRNARMSLLMELVDVGKVWKKVKLEQAIVVFGSKESPIYDNSLRINRRIVHKGVIQKKYVKDYGFILNSLSSDELEIANMLLAKHKRLSDVTSNKRGSMLQKHIVKNGDYGVLGGKHVQRWMLKPDVNYRINASCIEDEKAIIAENTVVVQNIVAHIANPVAHIKIAATVPSKDDASNYVILDTVNQIGCAGDTSSKIVCAILNSKLINWYCYRFIFARAIRTMHFDATVTSRIVYPEKISSNEGAALIKLSSRMLSLHENMTSVQTAYEQANIKRQIAATEKEIDRLVYKLYGLTEKEICIIERQ